MLKRNGTEKVGFVPLDRNPGNGHTYLTNKKKQS